MTHILAPGKIILFGEYAVLDGEPALVIAVDRHVRCQVTPGSKMRVCSLGVDGHTVPTEIDSPFLSAVTRAVGTTPGDFLVDSSAFQWMGVEGQFKKLGLGSSAAATVAFSAALRTQASISNSMSPSAIYQIAQDAHHEVQGTGSGADIAASCFGGAISYRWITDGAVPETSPNEVRIDCRAGTAVYSDLQGGPSHILVAWTGQSASTRALVHAVRTHRSTAAYTDVMALISKSSLDGREAWARSDYLGLRSAALLGVDALEQLGRLANTELVTEAHRKIQKLLHHEDVVVKPTGAGGGDLAWLVPHNGDRNEQILRRLENAGIPAWAMPVSARGVHLATND